MKTAEAFEVLRKALAEDADYAWSWHCGIAMAARDEGCDPAIANKAANRFLQQCFGVDSREPTAG